MYGLVNLAIQQLITEKFGEDTWEAVKVAADVDVDTFISLEAYPDALTYNLVAGASQVLAVPPEQLLESFGEYWVLYTGKSGYGYLMHPSTSTLPEFLQNLNHLHQRIGMTFPHLQPPRFTCTDITEDSLRLHYYSDRPGLSPMVRGLLRGLGTLFNCDLTITQVAVKGGNQDHDEFLLEYT